MRRKAESKTKRDNLKALLGEDDEPHKETKGDDSASESESEDEAKENLIEEDSDSDDDLDSEDEAAKDAELMDKLQSRALDIP